MRLGVYTPQESVVYCYIPLHVSSGGNFTFQKNPNNYRRFELKDTIAFSAYLDRECLRACQNYLKGGISAGAFDGTTKGYWPFLDWEPRWHFPYLTDAGTSEATLGSNGHISKFRVTWSVYNYDHSKYQVSNIEQIQ